VTSPIAPCRGLARFFAASEGLPGLEAAREGRGQDKGGRCAQPSPGGRRLVLQGFGASLRDVRENRARCAPHTMACTTRLCRTSRGSVR
jgi:hypothetical protein